nr:GNAT family N-acetyltransferase [Pelagibacterium xiamenense]
MRYKPATRIDLSELAAALNKGYEDYLIPIAFTKDSVDRMIGADGIDLASSYVLESSSGEPVGVMLVARRGQVSRLAALGLQKNFRGKRLGHNAVTRALTDAGARGDRAMQLEVIATNTAAVRLYENHGFKVTRRLVGYQIELAGTPAVRTGWHSCAPDASLDIIAPLLPGDLPWQIARESIVSIAPLLCGFANAAGTAAALFSFNEGKGRIMSMAVAPDARGKGLASEMIGALIATRPGHWSIPAVVPETLGNGALANAGWRRSAISQFEMRRTFAPT